MMPTNAEIVAFGLAAEAADNRSYFGGRALAFHRVTVDEEVDRPSGDQMFKAFCEDCEWSGSVWHHADEYQDAPVFEDSSGEDPASLACDAATRDGVEHIEGRVG